jgi:hypothetical protein
MSRGVEIASLIRLLECSPNSKGERNSDSAEINLSLSHDRDDKPSIGSQDRLEYVAERQSFTNPADSHRNPVRLTMEIKFFSPPDLA